MPDIEKIAEKLYEHYCREVGGKSFDGKPLPDWPEFRTDPTKKKQSEAWISVARLGFTLALQECVRLGSGREEVSRSANNKHNERGVLYYTKYKKDHPAAGNQAADSNEVVQTGGEA